ncbi:MAG: hypothetical protein CSA62_10210 [Planctomycetota bacterium]|nr:MAG: hypothetical protein CSA62_10210 [Planctomycetota bacterium]
MIAMLQDLMSQDGSSEALLETQSQLRWLDAPAAWVLGLLLIPALLLLIWWSYRGERMLSRRQRITLTSLRILALLLVLVASFRPALETTRNLRLCSEIHFLIDDSASMARKEAYSQERGEALLAALGDQAPSSSSELSRSEYVQRFFGGGGEDMAKRAAPPARQLIEGLAEDFDLRFFRFSDNSTPLVDLSELQAAAPFTRIGDSLDIHLGSFGKQGGQLEAMILISDGRNNEGLSPSAAAKRLKAAEIPLHCIGVGDPSEEHNLTLSGPNGPEQVLRGEEAVFELDVRATGLDARSAELILEAVRRDDQNPAESGDAAVLQTTRFPMPAKGQSRRVTLRHVFEEAGDYLLSFKVPPLPGETNPQDNITRRYLRVDSDKVRVLYIEEQPRWEYRYLKEALRRVDESIQFQCFLFDASHNFSQERSEGLAPLLRLPATREELFQYHAILIGDVPPSRFGATEEERARWFELLKDFVEHGGGLGILSGELAMPDSYRESVLEELLPVVLANPGDEELPSASTQAFRPLMENPHEPHPLLRLSENLEQNRLLWREGLMGMWWYYPVLRAKAGAQVLLRHPEDQNQYGRRVLAALGPYPKGKVFFAAVDEFWRWRKGYGEKYLDPFWRKVVRTLSENRLRRLDDRVLLTVDEKQIEIGGRVRVHVQLLDEDYNPVLEEKTTIHLRSPGGELLPIELPRLLGQPGEFEALVPFEEDGVYSILVYESAQPGGRPLAREDVVVEIPDKELAFASMNEKGLQELAQQGGGRYAPLHRVNELLAAFDGRGAGLKVLDRKTREIWDQAWTLLLVLLLLSLEWILRKKWRLV